MCRKICRFVMRSLPPLLFFLLVSHVHATVVSTSFGTPGASNYTIPPGTYALLVCCTGAGGSGGGAAIALAGYAGGGGGAGMTICERITVLGETYATVTIGAGGPSVTNAAGINGAPSKFAIGTRLLFAGGGGGATVGTSSVNGHGGGAAGTSNATGETGGSNTPFGSWNWVISVAGNNGATSLCSSGSTSQPLVSQLYTSPGPGGAGCGTGATPGGTGGTCQGGNFLGGAGGTSSATIAGGGGGGASGLAVGGNGAGVSNTTAGAGSKGSGGGGAYGGTTATGVSGAGGNGYCTVTPEE